MRIALRNANGDVISGVAPVTFTLNINDNEKVSPCSTVVATKKTQVRTEYTLAFKKQTCFIAGYENKWYTGTKIGDCMFPVPTICGC